MSAGEAGLLRTCEIESTAQESGPTFRIVFGLENGRPSGAAMERLKQLADGVGGIARFEMDQSSVPARRTDHGQHRLASRREDEDLPVRARYADLGKCAHTERIRNTPAQPRSGGRHGGDALRVRSVGEGMRDRQTFVRCQQDTFQLRYRAAQVFQVPLNLFLLCHNSSKIRRGPDPLPQSLSFIGSFPYLQYGLCEIE